MSIAAPPASLSSAPPAAPGMVGRLSVMMLLQYAIQGAWLPLLFGFLKDYRGFGDADAAWLGAVGAVGAVVSPFVAGQLADRYLNAERFMFLAHLAGAAVVYALTVVTGFWPLLALAFFYGVLYTPTLATANAIAFANLPDRDRDFGKVRVWGTIGWILVSIGMGQWLFRVHMGGGTLDEAATKAAVARGYVDGFYLSAILGTVQALYCLTLPKTPPAKERKNYAPGEALAEIRRQPLVTLFLLSIPVAAVHAFFFAELVPYLNHLNLEAPWIDKVFGRGPGPAAIGQISEVIVLALMPLLATRIPRKALLTVGLLAYAARFFVFAYLPYPWAIYPALALHGLVFGCFFFVCFMIVDEQTTPDVRSSAQNLFNLIVFGLGVILGNMLTGWVAGWTKGLDGQKNWQGYYAIPGWITVGCLVVLLVFYPWRVRKVTPVGER